MNTEDHEADAAWQRILGELRQTRRRRRQTKASLGIMALMLAGGLAFYMTTQAPTTMPKMVNVASPHKAAPTTWAVMVWRDGRPSLEARDPGDFDGAQLNFSLEPVIALTEVRGDDTDIFINGFRSDSN